ncbi:MAG: hypothetical protein B6D58_01100 [candidate division Zixibacteria bacterium 4484_95]|nr:MAG: hypothetical protein B6D58_01100 [candidate division Zixibacteria bacterium 4484_95]RKX20291.1 MAG: hypothetical protein DRP26_01960 [candidate division Zixibacteria bacterium]
MKRSNTYRQTGFTMIEMMIMIVLIGILASLTAPSFFNMMPRLKLKSEARTNLNYLRLARSKAISDNSQYGIYFDVNNGNLVYFKDTHDLQFAYYLAGQDSLIEGPISMASNVSYSNCTFMSNCVIFYSNGSASTSGSIDVVDSESGNSYTISVLASTGRVRLQ